MTGFQLDGLQYDLFRLGHQAESLQDDPVEVQAVAVQFLWENDSRCFLDHFTKSTAYVFGVQFFHFGPQVLEVLEVPLL